MAFPDNAFIKYDVNVRQQPLHARISAMKISDRRPVDPPIVVQLFVTDLRDDPLESKTSHRKSSHLTNPYFFMYAALVEAGSDNEVQFVADGGRPSTSGALVSSVRVLKDYPNSDQEAAFFIFPDICVRLEGSWRFKFTLFDIQDDKVRTCATTFSAPFFVYPGKQYPGVQISTPLTRALAAQGVRLRIRKEIREKVGEARPKPEDESHSPLSTTPPSPTSSLEMLSSPPKRRRTLPGPLLTSLPPVSYVSYAAPSPSVDLAHAFHMSQRTPSPVSPPFYELFNDSRLRRPSQDTTTTIENSERRQAMRDWATLSSYHQSNFPPPTPKVEPDMAPLAFLRPAHPSPEVTQIHRQESEHRRASVSAATYPLYSWPSQGRDGFATDGGQRRFADSAPASSAYWSSPSFETANAAHSSTWASYGAIIR
ncbi:velvet factor-domain-containing protein [Roridomyces roridus]|uniref:Velvet factor-domain-containing protein n=1 Tax=Roridomyces roridus TaxID=1738132 RepID=A0AAD7FYK1_9AGAR|nr:velvet factor-domain-containing protein [Roridomyces roridus]